MGNTLNNTIEHIFIQKKIKIWKKTKYSYRYCHWTTILKFTSDQNLHIFIFFFQQINTQVSVH